VAPLLVAPQSNLARLAPDIEILWNEFHWFTTSLELQRT
jgi:hypothetical protein